MSEEKKPAEAPPAEAPPPANDPRYYFLADPIQVDGRQLRYILLDPKVKKLAGRDFFAIVANYQRKFAEEARGQATNFQKYSSENFLSLVIAKLNGISPEDVYKIPYEELPLLFMQAASFQFSGANKQITE